ncbi:MAG: glycosyltransferase family 2 protein [Reinekea sp.]
MKISIITVCFNAEKTIRDTIESVLAQTHNDIEYIIVDGQSTDGTLAIVNEYQGRISKVISEKDRGIYDAMNKGINSATGDVVGILNSDDFFAGDNVIKIVANAFNSDTDAIFADLIYVNQADTSIPSRYYSSRGFKKWKMRFGFMVPHPTFYARRSLFQEHGCYEISYRVAADFELMARMFVTGIKYKRLDAVLVKMREGGISSSGLLWRLHQNVEIARACRKNGIFTLSPLMLIKLPFKLASFWKKSKHG